VREVFDVPASKGSYRELFSRDLIGSTVLAVMIAVVSGVSLYGFLGWLPTFLVKQGLDIRSSLLFVAIMGFGAPLGGLLGSLVADRFGRRRTLVVASVVQAALGVAYPAVTNNVQMVLCGFALSLCAYAVVAVGFALYIPEMFPTRSRLRGASVASGIGRLTSSGVGFVIVSVFGTFGITGVSGFLVACNLVLVACILLLGRETSQRALEEIETNPDTTALAAARTVAGD
jgi:putative MFS transporter